MQVGLGILVGCVLVGVLLVTEGFSASVQLANTSVPSVLFPAAGMGLLAGVSVLGWRRFLLAGTAFSLFLWFDKNFFYHEDHAGGAIGLSLGLLDLTLLAFLLTYPLARLAGSAPPLRGVPRLTGPYAALVGACTLSLLSTSVPSLSVLELIRMMKAFLLMLFVVNMVHDREDVWLVVQCLVAVVFLEGAIGLAQWLRGGTIGLRMFGEVPSLYQDTLTEGQELARVSGTFAHPMPFANVLGFLLPLVFAISFFGRTAGSRWLSTIAFLVGLAALLVTFSRAAIVTTALAVIGVVILSWRRRLGSPERWKHLVAFFVVVVLSAVPLLPKVIERFWYADPGSVGVRFDLQESSWLMLQGNWLFGIGLNTYSERLALIGDPYRIAEHMPDGQGVEHNLYLLLLVETGIFGCAMHLLVFSIVFRQAWRCYRSEDLLTAGIGIGVVMGYLAFFVRGFVDYSYRLDQAFMVFWFVAALLFAAQMSPHVCSTARDSRRVGGP